VAVPHELVRCPFDRAPLRPPQRGVLDLSSELKVLVGDPAGGVGVDLHGHLTPRHREVRVVVRGLGDVPDGVHEHQGGRPAVGLVGPADHAAFEPPPGECVELVPDLGVAVGALLGLRHDRLPRGYVTAPPLITSICPVMYLAAPKGRNTAPPATPSGGATRSSGTA